MEPHQSVEVTSSWIVQGPYDIHSVLQIQLAEETSANNSPSVSTRNIVLAPPPSANEDEKATLPCQVFLSCKSCIAIRSIEIISNARHIELYDSQDAYCCTVKGERHPDGEDNRLPELVLYSARMTVDSPVPQCRLKHAPLAESSCHSDLQDVEVQEPEPIDLLVTALFVSLTDKFQLTLGKLWVASSRAEAGSFSGVGSRSINMSIVRDMMSSLRQPIPDNVESLMQTVEQYQKNQATVLQDFQQVATGRLSASMPHDSKASLAANMAGILSTFCNATSLQQSRNHPSPGAPAGVTNAAISNESSIPHPAPDRQNHGGFLQPQVSDMDSLSKLAASFSGATQNAEMGYTSSNMGQDVLNALRTMCRDVSHMRAADRQAADRSYGPEKRSDQGDQEIFTENRETDKPADSQRLSELEHRLKENIIATEKSIIRRLDRKIELLQDHIDLRFNRLEALLEERSKGSSDQHDQFQSEDVD